MSDLFQTIAEKAESKKQQRLMGMVRAVQKGEMKSPSETVAKLAQSMKKKDVKDFASTKHDGLPEKKKVEEETEINEIAPALAAGAALGIAAGGAALVKKAAETGKAMRRNAERRMGKEPVKESAWQRKEGKNPSGGLNEKGRKSYERENPGSDLKAPQPEGGPRKRSFCARMGGMKGPMKDEKGRPTRKALSLRKWKC
jgi:hypothetical protein